MSKKLKLVKVTNIRERKPNPFLVAALKKLLKRAKSGEIQGFLGIFIFDNNEVDDCWYETPKKYHASVTNDNIIGAMERLKHKLLAIKTQAERERYFYADDDPEDVS